MGYDATNLTRDMYQEAADGDCPVGVGDTASHTHGRPFTGRVTAINMEYRTVTLVRGPNSLDVSWCFVRREN